MPLHRAWAREDRRALFLYLHIPFCEMRCGFCNLFTTVRPRHDATDDYLAALARQIRVVRDQIPDARFARMAIGGGTPTYLSAAQLANIFDLAADVLGADPRAIGASVETSPETATADRLAVLADRGVDRVSIGVQSFVDAEVRAVGRAQRADDVCAALDRIRMYEFRTLNIDLMYGLPGQTPATWTGSIERALAFAPQQLYLYPLYVRPLTGLGRSSRAAWDDERMALYQLGRDLLRSRGYRQVSMRMFRAADASEPDAKTDASASAAPQSDQRVYRCAEDGMVGLGVGARSYTRALHYSTDYAVGGRQIKAIIADYVARDDRAFAAADWGVALDDDDQRRRFAILSLLADGLDLARYHARFGGPALRHIPALAELVGAGLAARDGDRLALTDAGIARSDAIGPWLRSPRIDERMKAYQPR